MWIDRWLWDGGHLLRGVAWPWGGDHWLLGVIGRGFRLLGVALGGCEGKSKKKRFIIIIF